jgi:NAD(P)-dependent dehydrogenase (short-subunit alcohol dehydrogenase family)
MGGHNDPTKQEVIMTASRRAALITGGTTGIGHATARVFHEQGLRVLVTGSNPATIDAARRTLPDGVAILRADARSPEHAEAIGEEVRKKFGRLDVAFLNAGIGRMLPVEAIDEAIFDEHFAVNVKGQYFTLQKVLPVMVEGGSVIFTGATGGHLGAPNWSLYTATKGALLAMVRALAAELAPRRIRVNSISPGPVNNAAHERLGLPPELMATFRRAIPARVPLGRFGLEVEIARAVAFLASPAASFITGADIRADGGMSATFGPFHG